LGAAASACTSSSGASKKVESLPSFATLRTCPSLPLPAHNVPSGAAITVQRKGAAVSATSDGDGPRNIRPSLSMERPAASPFKKSACVETVQNVGVAAARPAHAASTTTPARIR
jgi:hypothetical protein